MTEEVGSHQTPNLPAGTFLVASQPPDCENLVSVVYEPPHLPTSVVLCGSSPSGLRQPIKPSFHPLNIEVTAPCLWPIHIESE